MTRDRDDAKALPCPFCGSDPKIREVEAWWFVECAKPRHEDCPVFAYTGAGTREEAIRRWNTRRGVVALVAEREQAARADTVRRAHAIVYGVRERYGECVAEAGAATKHEAERWGRWTMVALDTIDNDLRALAAPPQPERTP